MQSCKNSKSDFQMNHKIPSRTEVKSEGFSPYGIRLTLNLCANHYASHLVKMGNLLPERVEQKPQS